MSESPGSVHDGTLGIHIDWCINYVTYFSTDTCKTFRPDSIDLLFLGSSCTFMKWETENNI